MVYRGGESRGSSSKAMGVVALLVSIKFVQETGKTSVESLVREGIESQAEGTLFVVMSQKSHVSTLILGPRVLRDSSLSHRCIGFRM